MIRKIIQIDEHKCDGCGICVEANDPDALREAILELAADKDACAQMGRNGRRYIEENLTRAIGTAKWVDVMKQMADPHEEV